jgi:hypothetical protein
MIVFFWLKNDEPTTPVASCDKRLLLHGGLAESGKRDTASRKNSVSLFRRDKPYDAVKL